MKRVASTLVLVGLLASSAAAQGSGDVSWAVSENDRREGGRLDLKEVIVGKGFFGFTVHGRLHVRHLRGRYRYVLFKLDTRSGRRWDRFVYFDRVDVTSCVLTDGGSLERFGRIERRGRGLRCYVRWGARKRHWTWKVVSRYKHKDRAPNRGRFSFGSRALLPYGILLLLGASSSPTASARSAISSVRSRAKGSLCAQSGEVRRVEHARS